MNTEKEKILKAVLRIIAHIADKKYQLRIWIQEKGPEVDDFNETVCNFFQDCNGVVEEHEQYIITNKQHKKLKKFRDNFQAFADENDWPHLFIDTPEWIKITEEAKEVLKAFNHMH